MKYGLNLLDDVMIKKKKIFAMKCKPLYGFLERLKNLYGFWLALSYKKLRSPSLKKTTQRRQVFWYLVQDGSPGKIMSQKT